MSEIIIFKGDWFLPNKEQFKLPGELIVDSTTKNFKLILFADKHIDGEEFNKENISNKLLANIILGNDNNKFQKITLVEMNGFFSTCYSINKTLFRIEYQVQFVFEKIHFNNFEVKIFDNLFCRYDLPKSFFGNKQFFDFDTDNYSISYIRNDDYNFEYEKYKFSLCSLPSAIVDEQNSIEIENSYYIKIQSLEASSFMDLFLMLNKIRILFSLFVGYDLKILESFFKNKNVEQNKIHIRDYAVNEKRNLNLLNQHIVGLDTFSFEKLNPKILEWLNIYDTFESCVSLFMYAVKPIWKKGNRTLNNHEFTNVILNIIQAIEGFYKKDDSITYEEYLKDFKSQKENIISNFEILESKKEISIQDLDFIKINLKSSKKGTKNDLKANVNLVDIILYYCKENKTALSNSILEERFNIFSRDLKNIRNSLSHLNHKNASELGESFKIYKLFNVSQFLFLAVLFSKIGFTQEEIKELLNKVRTFG